MMASEAMTTIASAARPAALGGVRVLEISHCSAAVSGKHLAELGAEVIKIEPPGGEPARRIAPFVEPDGTTERLSVFWLAYNVGKRSVTLDLDTERGTEQFVELARTADIAVTDFQRLDAIQNDRLAALACAANPALIWTEICPFGRGGKYERLPAGELVLQALGGHLNLNGDTDRAPVMISLPVASLHGGVESVSACLMAYYHRLRTGIGQRVDISLQECVVWTLLNSTMAWQLLHVDERRGGAVRKERSNKFYTRLVWPCADGHIFFGPLGGGLGAVRAKSYRALVAWLAEEGIHDKLLTSKDWTGADAFRISQEEYDAVSEIIGNFLLTKTLDELMRRAVRDAILLAPVNSIPQILENPQLQARGYFESLHCGENGAALKLPLYWANFSATPLSVPRPPPAPGEHTREILGSIAERKQQTAWDA